MMNIGLNEDMAPDCPAFKELPPGTTLQERKYTIEKIIGTGGFGITYYARHNVFGHHFAVKEFFVSGYCVRHTQNMTVIPQGMDKMQYENYLSKFIEEAQILARLDHPNIVKVADIFKERNTAFMVMPFLEGLNLQQTVEQCGQLDYERTVNYIAQIAEAAGYIHRQNILHRDIKPDNIIITPEDRAILIDFGSAREFVQGRTQSHTSILTRGYAPLEQYSARSHKGAFSDIYSMGAVFYFALTGVKPTDAATRTLENMPDPQAFVPSIPDAANRTIIKALQLKSELRHQSVEEFMDDLLNVKPSVSVPQPVRKRNEDIPQQRIEVKPIISPVVEKPVKKDRNITAWTASIIVAIMILSWLGLGTWGHYQNKKDAVQLEMARQARAAQEEKIRQEQLAEQRRIELEKEQERRTQERLFAENTWLSGEWGFSNNGFQLVIRIMDSHNAVYYYTSEDTGDRRERRVRYKIQNTDLMIMSENETAIFFRFRMDAGNHRLYYDNIPLVHSSEILKAKENEKLFNEARKRALELYKFAQETDADFYVDALKFCDKALSHNPGNAEMNSLKRKIKAQLR
jgi:serine/threonine protein kinase